MAERSCVYSENYDFALRENAFNPLEELARKLEALGLIRVPFPADGVFGVIFIRRLNCGDSGGDNHLPMTQNVDCG